MSAYIRTPLEYKKVPLCNKGMVSAKAVRDHQLRINRRTAEAQSLIASVLMANNGLNPAQKEALRKAKDLLND